MTNGHYDFDEIVECIYSPAKSDEERQNLYNISAHVFKCKKCAKIYEALYNVYELGFNPEHALMHLSKEGYKEEEFETETDSDWDMEM